MSSVSWNPPSRFGTAHIEWVEPPPPPRLQVRLDRSKSILSRNHSGDLGFDWSLNPYRGCTHACAYCYARAWHENLDLGAGTDFERTILVKENAPELLRQTFEKRSWTGELIALSGATDCYQPLERKWELTRRCLSICADYRNPVTIVTRSPLIVRDVDILKRLARHRAVRVSVSIPLLDRTVCRAMEPGAPGPAARLHAVSALTDAGIEVGVSLSPMIPGLNDDRIPATLRAAREAGALWVWMGMVRFPGPTREIFERRLRERLPLRADRVMAKLDRAGVDQPTGERRRGRGPAWEMTERLFEVWRRRLGFRLPEPWGATPFRRPGQGTQLSLL